MDQAAAVGAPESRPTGYGQSTTGCGSTNYVTASSFSAIQSLIDAYSGSGGLCIKYTGTFDFSSISDPCTMHTQSAQTIEIKNKGNITIMGADGSGAHFGFHIVGAANNVIIRNMKIGLLAGGSSADAIGIEGNSSGAPNNVWVDHNELFSSMVECSGAGDSEFDGLIDVKKGADNVTVSYNYIHDHHKVSLNGYSDSETKTRHITFHHNIIENVGSRTPLQRIGYSHLLSNYFNKIAVSGANIRMGGYSLIESNYFENSQNPVTSRDSSAIGYWDLRNNNIMSPSDFGTYNITWVASSSSPSRDATDWTTTAKFPVSLGYSYTADSPQCVKDGLRAVAGSGKGLATLSCSGGTTSYTLTIGVSGNGTTSPSPGSYSYASGATANVTATPASGYTFTGWSGAASGTANPVSVTMNASKTLTANFAPVSSSNYTLTIAVSGSGSTNPSAGSHSYASGTAVVVTATPASGYTFTGWSGAASGTANPVSITVTANQTLTATFSPASTGGSTIQEGATGFCSVDGSISTSNAGYTGSGYANMSNSAGKGVNWSVNAPSAGSYTLTFQYENGSSSAVTGGVILVNGATAVSSATFPKTSSKTTWVPISFTVALKAGVNAVRLQAAADGEFADIDYLQVSGGAVGASCN
jgi:pectate lyase